MRMCRPGWGNLCAFDWNSLPMGREFDGKFLKNVKSPPHALPPRQLYIDRCIISITFLPGKWNSKVPWFSGLIFLKSMTHTKTERIKQQELPIKDWETGRVWRSGERRQVVSEGSLYHIFYDATAHLITFPQGIKSAERIPCPSWPFKVSSVLFVLRFHRFIVPLTDLCKEIKRYLTVSNSIFSTLNHSIKPSSYEVTLIWLQCWRLPITPNWM